jgi:hypothetical protein
MKPMVHENDGWWFALLAIILVIEAGVFTPLTAIFGGLLGWWAAHLAHQKGHPYVKWFALGVFCAIVTIPYAGIWLKPRKTYVELLADARRAKVAAADELRAKEEYLRLHKEEYLRLHGEG